MSRIFSLFTAVILVLTLAAGMTGCKKPDTTEGFSIESDITKESLDYLEINLDIPVVSGFEAAAEINSTINERIAEARVEVEDAAEIMKNEGSQMKAGLGSSFLYSKSGPILSIWIMMDNYTGGAHGLYWLETYTFNTKTNEIYDFSDLFNEGSDYITVINNKLISEINKTPENYFPTAAETIVSRNGDLSYFINGDKIVVFFSLYDIAPYAAGIRYFEFDADEINYLLKPEIYEAIKDSAPIKTEGTIFEY